MSQPNRPRCEACGGYRLVIGDDKWDCLDCDEKEATDPLLSIRKSRLEAALRDAVQDAYSGGIEFALRKPPLNHDDAQARWDLLVARALTELEQA